MILPSDSDRVGGATFIILLKKKQNYKSTAWFMQQAPGSRRRQLTSPALIANSGPAAGVNIVVGKNRFSIFKALLI